MNQKNFDYLKDQVKFTGFGDSLENELREKIARQEPSFTIQHQRQFGKDDTVSVLHFKKPEQSDVYFFNSYELSVKQEKANEAVKQTFYIGRENNFTLKEAFNLLAGRAVYKELNKLEKLGEGEQAQYKPTDEKYNAWVQLDFKNTETNGNFKMKYYHENYGFDIVKELAKHPIKELSNEADKNKLILSLEKGNRQSVKFIIDGKEQNRFIEAVPQWKSLNIYDGNNKRIRTQKQNEDNTGQKEGVSKKEKQEQGLDEGEPAPKRQVRRTRNNRQSIT